MIAYKQIMPRLTTALTGMQKHSKIYTVHCMMYHTVHCDKQKNILKDIKTVVFKLNNCRKQEKTFTLRSGGRLRA